jgi:hypothetical protein
MDQGLMTGICNTLKTDNFRAYKWTEKTALSPFPSGWMELMALQNGNIHQHDRALIPLSMATSMYFYALDHVGYASNHHFHIRYAEADIKRQTAGLVLHLAKYILFMEPEPSPIAVRHGLSIEKGDISLYVSDAMTKWLIDETKLVPTPPPKTFLQENFCTNR